MLPVLRAAANGEARIGDVVRQLSDEFGLTAEERDEILPSGKQTTISNRVHWAKTYLTKAGLLQSTRRAHFTITERGRQVLAKQPGRIDNNYLSQFEEFIEFRRRSLGNRDREEAVETTATLPTDQTPDEIMRIAHRDIEKALRQELLERILTNSPDFFEHLVVDLLVAMGYGGSVDNAGRRLGRTGDGGVDGVIDQDALGLDRVYVQAKRYQLGNNVGAGPIRDFFGSLDRFKAAKGLFVTTSDFSNDAEDTAEQLSKRIVLINGDLLAGLMIRFGVGVRTEETLYLKKIDEDFFPD
jgi:restriction system protein